MLVISRYYDETYVVKVMQMGIVFQKDALKWIVMMEIFKSQILTIILNLRWKDHTNFKWKNNQGQNFNQ